MYHYQQPKVQLSPQLRNIESKACRYKYKHKHSLLPRGRLATPLHNDYCTLNCHAHNQHLVFRSSLHTSQISHSLLYPSLWLLVPGLSSQFLPLFLVLGVPLASKWDRPLFEACFYSTNYGMLPHFLPPRKSYPSL